MKYSHILATFLSMLLATVIACAGDTIPDNTKAAKIRLPKVQLSQATIEEGIAFFLKQSRERDPTYAGSGVPIIFVSSDKTKATRVTLDLVNVSFVEAVKYFAIAANLKMMRDGEAIVLKRK